MNSHIQNGQRKIKVATSALEQFVSRMCLRLRLPQADFTIRLANDRRIRELNRRFRGKDKATDVLSFPVNASKETGNLEERDYLGDIIISLDTAQRQASQRGHSLEREIKILMLHGLLHLLGYDHETDQGQMRRRELHLQKELLSERDV